MEKSTTYPKAMKDSLGYINIMNIYDYEYLCETLYKEIKCLYGFIYEFFLSIPLSSFH